MSLDDIVKEGGTIVTEKENDRIERLKDFFLSDTIKRNARVQSSHNLNFSSSVERSCGGIDDADICHLSEKSFLRKER